MSSVPRVLGWRLWLAIAVPSISISCGPIPDEIATTTIGVLPLAWLISWLLGRGPRSPSPELELEDAGPPKRGRPRIIPALSGAILVVLAGFAVASPDFESGALVAAIVIVPAAALAYTLVVGRVGLAAGAKPPLDWAPTLACGLILAPWLVVWPAEGPIEDMLLELGLFMLVVGAFVVLPLTGLYILVNTPSDSDED